MKNAHIQNTMNLNSIVLANSVVSFVFLFTEGDRCIKNYFNPLPEN